MEDIQIASPQFSLINYSGDEEERLKYYDEKSIDEYFL